MVESLVHVEMAVDLRGGQRPPGAARSIVNHLNKWHKINNVLSRASAAEISLIFWTFVTIDSLIS